MGTPKPSDLLGSKLHVQTLFPVVRWHKQGCACFLLGYWNWTLINITMVTRRYRDIDAKLVIPTSSAHRHLHLGAQGCRIASQLSHAPAQPRERASAAQGDCGPDPRFPTPPPSRGGGVGNPQARGRQPLAPPWDLPCPCQHQSARHSSTHNGLDFSDWNRLSSTPARGAE